MIIFGFYKTSKHNTKLILLLILWKMYLIWLFVIKKLQNNHRIDSCDYAIFVITVFKSTSINKGMYSGT